MDGSYVLPSLRTLRSSTSASSLDSNATSPVLVRTTSKRAEILVAVASDDLPTLRTLSAQFGGFEDDGLRKLVWPLLLRINENNNEKEPESRSKEGITPLASATTPPSPTPHKDEGQVKLDVNRSFVSFPENISTQEKDKLRLELEHVIVTILRRHPSLHYFQGYHDIVSVFLLVFKDTELTIRAVESMSLHRIRDSMGTGLEPVLGYLKLVHRILARADPDLARNVEYAASLPYFSLSWVLTLMSHDLTSLPTIARLFDFLLTTNPAMVSYLATAIILKKKDDIAQLDEDEQEDPAILHHTLSKLPLIKSLYSLPFPILSKSTPPKPEEDEDLISNDTRSILSSDSLTTLSRDDDYSDNWTGEIDALEDSMLCDPDIFGPAFASGITDRSTSFDRDHEAREGGVLISPALGREVTLEELIETSLDLWEKYPLLGSTEVGEEGEKVEKDGIAADEVMGSKSCIFTWSLSMEGKLSDAQAAAIASAGIDIVISVPPPPTSDELRIIKDLAERREKRLRDIIRRRRIQLGFGATLSVLGIAGVVLAVYGGRFAKGEWRVTEWTGWVLSRRWDAVWSF